VDPAGRSRQRAHQNPTIELRRRIVVRIGEDGLAEQVGQNFANTLRESRFVKLLACQEGAKQDPTLVCVTVPDDRVWILDKALSAGRDDLWTDLGQPPQGGESRPSP
jgi:hypothetical protein